LRELWVPYRGRDHRKLGVAFILHTHVRFEQGIAEVRAV